MISIILTIVAIWLICAIFSAGVFYAYFRGEYPATDPREELGAALLFGIAFGPVGAIESVFLSSFLKYGWRLWD